MPTIKIDITKFSKRKMTRKQTASKEQNIQDKHTHKDGKSKMKWKMKKKERKKKNAKNRTEQSNKQERKKEREERANISSKSERPENDAILDAPGYIQPGGYSHVMGLIRQSLTERPNGGGVS